MNFAVHCRIVTLLSLGLVLGLSCKHVAPSESALRHDEGRFSSHEASGQWQKIDQTIFRELEPLADKALPEDNPLAKRMQAWSDAIRKEMMTFDRGVAAAERPIIKIVPSKEQNGYVSSASVCGSAAVTVLGTNPDPASAVESVDVPFSQGLNTTRDCVSLSSDLKLQKEFLEWSLRGKAGCTISIKGAGLTVSAGCVDEAKAESVTYKGFRGIATPNYVVLYTGLLDILTEEETVGVLAHELGHYFRSHATLAEGDGSYDYFYRSGTVNHNARPIPVLKDDPLFDLANQLSRYKNIDFAKVPGATVSPLYYFSVYNTVNAPSSMLCLDGHPDCVVQCEGMKSRLEGEYEKQLSSFPFVLSETEESKRAYAQYESDLKSCLSKIEAMGPARSLVFDIQDAFGDLEKFTLPTATKSQDFYSYLREATELAGPTMAKHEAKRDELAEKATEQGLGWYTTEQEADDIAMEALVRLGISPENFIQAHIKWAKVQSPKDGLRCEESFKAGFPKPIPLGSLSSIHHSNCYRAYNSHRERIAHKDYFSTFEGRARPKIQPGVSWEKALESGR